MKFVFFPSFRQFEDKQREREIEIAEKILMEKRVLEKKKRLMPELFMDAKTEKSKVSNRSFLFIHSCIHWDNLYSTSRNLLKATSSPITKIMFSF